ncbi:MAG: hypothetical protein Q3979_08205 [Actinomycetaceae bacterium]|nr:hypothetical protein [Actinomycetaceae bacterium]
MDTRTILEIIGWTGSGLVVLSLVVANQRTFRWLNFAGAFIVTTYNLILGVWPAVGMNAVIALIDLYWLMRLHAEAKAPGLEASGPKAQGNRPAEVDVSANAGAARLA